MKHDKIDVTINLPEGEDVDMQFPMCSLAGAFEEAARRYPDYTSIVLIVVKS